ncbi:MAG: hypothetical protein KAS77_01715, partial [Thermoplasmata archaeon]|nr:hypothetical protein [Thermoplasmata archaeon]
NGDGYDDILIGAHWNDDGGIDAGQTYLVFYDDGSPRIEFDMTPGRATTGDRFIFNVTVSDSSGIYNVTIEHWYGDSQSHQNVSAVQASGNQTEGTWLLNITIPLNSIQSLHYIVHARDVTGLLKSTRQKDVNVTDNDPPTFRVNISPAAAETGLTYVFSITVRDNIWVDEVWVDYWYGEGEVTRMTMPFYSGDTRAGSIIVEDTLDDLHYVFGSNDISGNTNFTHEYTVEVIDINGPEIVNEGTNHTATTGDPHEFTITAIDSLGLRSATLWYAFGEGELVPEEMEAIVEHPSSGNVLYSLVIDVPSDLAGNITYRYEIEDLYGNVQLTHVDIIRVRDNDPPEIVEDRTPGEVGMGEDLTFVVVVSDNVGFWSVEVEYSVADGDPVTAEMAPDGTEGAHTLTIGVAIDEMGPISYRFMVMDRGWNEVNGTQRQVSVVDGIPPELEHSNGELLVSKGQDCELHVTVRDNIGVGRVIISYRFSEGTEESVPMERTPSGGDTYCEVMIPVPRWVEGPLFYRFTAEDAAGNANVTEWFEGTCVNRPPELKGDPPIWYVTEEVTATLDLTDHIVDGNDHATALTAACDAPGIDVSGLVLQTRYDSWVPEHRLEVRVTDGEDTLWFNVTVRVTNVNDAPIIRSVSPENGSKYKEGKVLNMSVDVDDEDGDELTVTWTSDGVTIGSGDTLEYKKLKPGTRTIKVTVSDGEASVEEEFTLVIKKEEESPALGGVFVLLAMLVGLAALMIRRKG